jgi:hypothetical protein
MSEYLEALACPENEDVSEVLRDLGLDGEDAQ